MIGSAEETSLEKGVWISGRRRRKKKKENLPSVYFSLSLLVCLLLSNQHLLLWRRLLSAMYFLIMQTPSAFPESEFQEQLHHNVLLFSVPPHLGGVCEHLCSCYIKKQLGWCLGKRFSEFI